MALWSIKRVEAGPVNPLISEAPIPITMIDKDTGQIVITTVLATFTSGYLDVVPTLQTLTDDEFWPNDWAGTPSP